MVKDRRKDPMLGLVGMRRPWTSIQQLPYLNREEYDVMVKEELERRRLKYGPGEWYTDCDPKTRWKLAINGARSTCPRDHPEKLGHEGRNYFCHMYLELLVDCPPDMLEGYNFPPQSTLGESVLTAPFRRVEPCKMWKSILEKCRNENSHYDAAWKCVPFEGFMVDHGCGMNSS